MNNIRKSFIITFVVFLAANAIDTTAQTSSSRKHQQTTQQAAATPVAGGGTSGQIGKWIGFDGPTSVIGDSTITEDKFGRIGIGTTAPTSPLTVKGMIETTLGGYKFPDGTVQSTAGLSFVNHDASLIGLGNGASPLAIAPGGVNTIHLADGAVTAPKIANATVVRSFNGLFDNISLAAGSNITISASGNTLTIAAPNSLTSVSHDATLTGAGSSSSPLGVAAGGIGNTQLANNAVTLSKIAPDQVVTSLNNINDNVTLAAGSNITITPSGNTLTIAGSFEGSQTFTARGGSVGFLSNPGKVVVSKTVPAGNYVINFTIELFNADTDNQKTTCTLSTGDSASIVLAPINEADTGSLTLLDTAALGAETTISVTCVGFKAAVNRSVITATKVGSIQ
jgi:hypothetical protein